MSQYGGIPHLAERLNVLFARVPRPGGTGQPYSNELAADELHNLGVSVTGTYLSQLRSGRRDNPSAKLLAAIADLFQVPISYFFDAQASPDPSTGSGNGKDRRIREIVAQAADVSDAGIASLEAILQQIRQIEGLNEAPPPIRERPSLPHQARQARETADHAVR